MPDTRSRLARVDANRESRIAYRVSRIAYRAATHILKLGCARRFGQAATQRFDAGALDVRRIAHGGRRRRSTGPASPRSRR
ncbi:hypothetical protein, partial [Burkholderia humptydooensis]|uniref:hypothetical protein n=1 Tax=Burkholderia humptydooensis TaxID=430531 RepID=UPI001E3C45F2